MEEVTWVVKYADTLSVVTYLALTILLFGLALYRKWVVLGWTYSKLEADYENVCKDRDTLREEADRRAERIERKLEIYEEAERLQRSPRRTRQSGSS